MYIYISTLPSTSSGSVNNKCRVIKKSKSRALWKHKKEVDRRRRYSTTISGSQLSHKPHLLLVRDNGRIDQRFGRRGYRWKPTPRRRRWWRDLEGREIQIYLGWCSYIESSSVLSVIFCWDFDIVLNDSSFWIWTWSQVVSGEEEDQNRAGGSSHGRRQNLEVRIQNSNRLGIRTDFWKSKLWLASNVINLGVSGFSRNTWFVEEAYSQSNLSYVIGNCNVEAYLFCFALLLDSLLKWK